MLRALLCGFVGLALAVGVSLAEEKKADAKGTRGTFVSWKDGTLTVKVSPKEGEPGKPMEFKIPDNVKVFNYVGADRKEVALKEAFTTLKADTPVLIERDGDKITTVIIGTPKKATKDK